MKKLFIILISIFLLLSSFALGFFVKKHIDDKKIFYLTNEKFNLNIVNNDLISKIKKLEYRLSKNNSQKEDYNLEEYKHPIDIEEEQCINNSNVYDYSLCGEKAEKAWDREIQKNTELLKKVMTNEDFKYIKNMNETWNKSLYNQQDIINRFISNKEGLIHQTDGQNNIVQIKKQYALLLKSIYYNYYEEDREFKN